MDFDIVFAPAPTGDELPWKLKWRNALIGAFTSEADAKLFRSALRIK